MRAHKFIYVMRIGLLMPDNITRLQELQEYKKDDLIWLVMQLESNLNFVTEQYREVKKCLK